MTETEQAGLWALVYLYIALFATWFSIACIVGSHIKNWFL